VKVKGKLITKAESRSSTAHPEEQTIIKEGQLDSIPFKTQGTINVLSMASMEA
jgi:hypothetical protein